MTGNVSRIEWVALLAVIALAAFLRFGYFGVNSFAFDEARLSLIALRMARAGEFATVGMPSSAGVPNMPAAAWVFALPYALSKNPLVATGFVSLLSLAAVVGVWGLARHWGTWAGLAAALYLAANPFAVLYGRSVWAQNLLIPLAVAWLWVAFFAKDRRAAAGGAVFLAGFAPQIHFAGAALTLATMYAFFRFRWHLRPALVGGALAVVCALPFLLTPGALRDLFGAASDPAQIDLTATRETLRLIAGHDWAYLLHGDAAIPFERAPQAVIRGGLALLGAIAVGFMALFGFAAVYGVDERADPAAQPVRERMRPVTRARAFVPSSRLVELSVAVLLAAPLLFTWHRTPVFIHYMLTSVPAAALLIGFGLGWLGAKRTVSLLALVIPVLLAVNWTADLRGSMAYARDHLTPNGLSTPLGVLLDASAEPAQPVVYHTFGDDPNLQGEPAIFSALWWGEDARIIDGQNLLVLPPDPVTLMFTERPFQAWEELREGDLLGDMHEIPRRENREPFQMTAYDGEAAPSGFSALSVEFPDGAMLEGWRVYQVGPRTRISTLWRSPGPLNANLQQFHHLRATPDDTEPLAVSDVSVRGHTWLAGDRVIVMADFLDLAPGDYWIDTGRYTLPDLTRQPLPDADFVRLGPFTVE